MEKEAGIQSIIFCLCIFFLFLLAGCALPPKEGLHYKCYTSVDLESDCLRGWSPVDLAGYYYDSDSDSCVFGKSNGCFPMPFSREEQCVEFCVRDNPRWSLLPDAELQQYIEFFNIWEQEHKSHVLVHGKHITTPADFQRYAEQSTCDVRVLDLYLHEFFRANTVIYIHEKAKNISKEQLQEKFGCLGSLTFDEESYKQESRSFLEELTKGSGGKVTNDTEFFDLLKNMSEEGMRQRNQL